MQFSDLYISYGYEIAVGVTIVSILATIIWNYVRKSEKSRLEEDRQKLKSGKHKDSLLLARGKFGALNNLGATGSDKKKTSPIREEPDRPKIDKDADSDGLKESSKSKVQFQLPNQRQVPQKDDSDSEDIETRDDYDASRIAGITSSKDDEAIAKFFQEQKLNGKLASAKLTQEVKALEKSWSEAERDDEVKAREQQMNQIYNMMKQQNEKFGLGEVDIREQMKMYAF